MLWGTPHASRDQFVEYVEARVVFHSHEASFVYNRRGVWNSNWCGPRELFHLVAEPNRELRTFFLAISGDIGSNELLDFFGIQTLGALGWYWFYSEQGRRRWLWFLKAFFFQCLVTIVVRDVGGSNDGWGCFACGFLSGSTVSGVVPFVMAVEALAASLQVFVRWHNVVPYWVTSYGRFLGKNLAVEH